MYSKPIGFARTFYDLKNATVNDRSRTIVVPGTFLSRSPSRFCCFRAQQQSLDLHLLSTIQRHQFDRGKNRPCLADVELSVIV